jgi:NitT/TauT family transport system permease protein
MASPSDLIPRYIQFWDLFLIKSWETLVAHRRGPCAGRVVGTLIGMVMGFSRFAREGLYPILVGFNAIPKATVVPIVALMFVGQHDFNTVLIAFMISFFPIAVSVSIGLSHAGARIPGHPAIARRIEFHDLLENRPAQDPAGILRRPEGRQ